MKKIMSLVLALALFVGCAVSASALTIGFSQVGQEYDWRTANTDDMCAAIEAEGWTLVYDDAQQKQENQVKALRNFITQGVDYILFTGVVTTGWDEVLKEVNEAEIPLFLLDRMPDCMDKIDYVAAFGGDFLEEGRRMARWTINYLDSIGRGDEEHMGKVERHLDIMIPEGAVLLGIQYLQQGGGGIAAVIIAELIYLIQQQHGIGAAGLLDGIDDTTGHTAYISFPMTADLGFIFDTAQRDTSIAASHRLRDAAYD